MKYLDKNGDEIKAGMHIQMEDGSIEKVYEISDGYGGTDLGINASNEAYMKAHGLTEEYREYYSLSNFSMKKTEICEPEIEMTQQTM